MEAACEKKALVLCGAKLRGNHIKCNYQYYEPVPAYAGQEPRRINEEAAHWPADQDLSESEPPQTPKEFSFVCSYQDKGGHLYYPLWNILFETKVLSN